MYLIILLIGAKRGRGRPKKKWADYIVDWTGKFFALAPSMAHNLQEWRELMKKGPRQISIFIHQAKNVLFSAYEFEFMQCIMGRGGSAAECWTVNRGSPSLNPLCERIVFAQ